MGRVGGGMGLVRPHTVCQPPPPMLACASSVPRAHSNLFRARESVCGVGAAADAQIEFPSAPGWAPLHPTPTRRARAGGPVPAGWGDLPLPTGWWQPPPRARGDSRGAGGVADGAPLSQLVLYARRGAAAGGCIGTSAKTPPQPGIAMPKTRRPTGGRASAR